MDSIELDPKCDTYTPEPSRGHYLLISLQAETSNTYNFDRDGHGPLYINWSTTGADGVCEPAVDIQFPCRASTDFTSEMRPAANYRGTVTIDTANGSGQLVLKDCAAWTFPT